MEIHNVAVTSSIYIYAESPILLHTVKLVELLTTPFEGQEGSETLGKLVGGQQRTFVRVVGGLDLQSDSHPIAGCTAVLQPLSRIYTALSSGSLARKAPTK